MKITDGGQQGVQKQIFNIKIQDTEERIAGILMPQWAAIMEVVIKVFVPLPTLIQPTTPTTIQNQKFSVREIATRIQNTPTPHKQDDGVLEKYLKQSLSIEVR